MSMSSDDFETYWLAITPIEAQNMLMQMRVADYPHLTKNDRTKSHKELWKLAYPKFSDADSDKSVSTRELAKILAIGKK